MYSDEELQALSLIACKSEQWREKNIKIIKTAGKLLDLLMVTKEEEDTSIDLVSFREYRRSQDKGNTGAREKIRNVLEAAGVEITKTKRGKYVATMRK